MPCCAKTRREEMGQPPDEFHSLHSLMLESTRVEADGLAPFTIQASFTPFQHMRSLPHKICEVDPTVNKELMRDFTGEHSGFLQVGEAKWFLPSKYRKMAEDLYNFTVRPDDTWVVTFPRSGTTLTQEMVWLLGNDLDYKTASEVHLKNRFPFIEFPMLMHDEVVKKLQSLNQDDIQKKTQVEQLDQSLTEVLASMTSPRFIKTHLPFSLLPPGLLTSGCKVLYVARNPMDVVVSYYHLNRRFLFKGYKGSFDKYWEYFQNGLVTFGPYWAHVTEGWQQRENPNLLFLFYEDIVREMPTTIRKVASFLDKDISDEQVETLAEHLHIDNFRANPSVQPNPRPVAGMHTEGAQDFIRKGKAGAWVEEFSPGKIEEAEKWMNENLSKTDLCFPI